MNIFEAKPQRFAPIAGLWECCRIQFNNFSELTIHPKIHKQQENTMLITFCIILQIPKDIVLKFLLQQFTLRMFQLVSMKGFCLETHHLSKNWNRNIYPPKPLGKYHPRFLNTYLLNLKIKSPKAFMA